MADPPPESPTMLEAIVQILITVTAVTVAILLIGSVVADVGRVLVALATFIAGITAVGGWFTDVLEPPRGRISTVGSRRPRRRAAMAKGSSRQKRR